MRLTKQRHSAHTKRANFAGRLSSTGLLALFANVSFVDIRLAAVSNAASLSQSQVDSAPDWDTTLKETFWRERSALYEQNRKAVDEQAHKQWLKAYDAYLKSPEWEAKE